MSSANQSRLSSSPVKENLVPPPNVRPPPRSPIHRAPLKRKAPETPSSILPPPKKLLYSSDYDRNALRAQQHTFRVDSPSTVPSSTFYARRPLGPRLPVRPAVSVTSAGSRRIPQSPQPPTSSTPLSSPRNPAVTGVSTPITSQIGSQQPPGAPARPSFSFVAPPGPSAIPALYLERPAVALTHAPVQPKSLPPSSTLVRNAPPHVPTVKICQDCGGTNFADVGGAEKARMRESLDGAGPVLHLLRERGLPLGRFLSVVFDKERWDDLDQPSRKQIEWFLHGATKGGHPVDVVRSIFDHPQSRSKQGTVQQFIFPECSVPPSSSFDSPEQEKEALLVLRPPDTSDGAGRSQLCVRARDALLPFFVDTVVAEMSREADHLMRDEVMKGPTSGRTDEKLSWDSLTSFSFGLTMLHMIVYAPIMWILLTSAAIGKNRSARIKEVNSSEENESGRGSNNTRDPWLASVFVAHILCYFRLREANALQQIVGILLFASNTSRSVISILNRLGVASAYSTTLESLRKLGKSTAQAHLSMGREIARKERWVRATWDNVNEHLKVWRASLGKVARVASGTFYNLIQMTVKDPSAFDGQEYMRRRSQIPVEDITFNKLLNDIDADHLESVSTRNIILILMKFIPTLRRHAPAIEATLGKKCEKRPAPKPIQKTEYQPLQCSGFDESTVLGTKSVMRDIFTRQLGLTDEELDGRLFMVSGDQMSVSRLRTLQAQTAKGSTWYSRNRYVLGVIETWHMQFAFLKSIVRLHWARKIVKGDVGLRAAADKLGRHINPEKPDFYPADRLLEVTLASDVLHLIRCAIRQKSTPNSADPETARPLHLVEELQYYDTPGQYLHGCTAEDIVQLVRGIYTGFCSSEAAYYALEAPSDQAREFFRRVIDPSALHSIATPQAGPPPLPSRSDLDFEENQEIEDNNDGEWDDDAEDARPEETTCSNSGPMLIHGSWLYFCGQLNSDILLYNSIIFRRDVLYYWEFRESVHEGDIGRTFKIMHWLRLFFPGAGATNYGTELLHLALDFWYSFTEATKEAVCANYLVNLSGKDDGHQGGDMLQEHLNGLLKEVFNGKSLGFDSRYLQEVISLNIVAMMRLREAFVKKLGLASVRSSRSQANIEADVNCLGHSHMLSEPHRYSPNRQQSFIVKDGYTRGGAKLKEGSLQGFVERHVHF